MDDEMNKLFKCVVVINFFMTTRKWYYISVSESLFDNFDLRVTSSYEAMFFLPNPLYKTWTVDQYLLMQW